jgi:predicted  nucleic acid-binding Zn-ribbon protein
MSTSQIPCSHCSKSYEPFKTAHGKISKLCPSCRENQRKSDEKRKDRVRNYQAEAKRNLEQNWISFQRISAVKRGKDVLLTKEQYLELIQKPCYFCGHYDENEIVGIDRVDNGQGYSKDNCVPACKFCNRMKHILHPRFFVAKAHLIDRHQGQNLSDTERDAFYTEWKEYLHTAPQPYIYVKRINEEKRGLPFNITKEQYEDLIYKPCYLCGFKNRHGNGLDRIDNTKREYSIENVQPCCSTCNMMKAHFNKEEFLVAIQKIVAHNLSIPDSWRSIPRRGFQMGGSKSEKVKEEKEKQWRAKTIYKAIKADTLQDFKKKVMGQTKWTEKEFHKITDDLFAKCKTGTFEELEQDLKKLVARIRYTRLGRSE